MVLTVEATYTKGVLKPARRLRIPEGSKVHITIMPADEVKDPLDKVIGICKGGPKDGAANHDMYIYGDPRS